MTRLRLLPRITLVLIAVVAAATSTAPEAAAQPGPGRDPYSQDPGGFWGGNEEGGGWGACLLGIGDSMEFCNGGYESPDLFIYWWVFCTDTGCEAGAVCANGNQVSCEGEYQAGGTHGGVYCWDTGGWVSESQSCLN